MSRYYFHIRTPHGLARDADGLELDSLAEARAVAEIAAREAIIEMVYDGEIRLDLAIEISDEHGAPLLAVRYSDVVKLVGGVPGRPRSGR